MVIYIIGCSDPEIPDLPQENRNVILSDSTIILSPEVVEGVLVEYTETGDISLKNDFVEAEGVDIGSVLASDVCDQAPFGFLRKVTGITKNGDIVRVQTVQADLTDAIKSCDIKDSIIVYRDDVDSVSVIEGVELLPIDRNILYSTEEGIYKEFNFGVDLIVYDKDGNISTGNDQIRIEGEFGISVGLELEIDIDYNEGLFKPQLNGLTLACKKSTNLSLLAKYSAKMDLTEPYKKKVATIHAGTYSIPAGIIIVVVADIDIYFVVSVTGEISVELGYSMTETSRFGWRYRNGLWEEFDETEKTIEPFGLSLKGALKAKAGVPLRLKLKIYGVAGPYIEGEVYAVAEASVEGGTEGFEVCAEVAVGVMARAGFILEVFSKVLADFNAERDVYRLVLLDNCIPLESTPPAPIIDLVALSPTANSITLAWTAPGDDGDVGTASSYDIRHSTSSITETTWDVATQCIGEPSPQPAGQQENYLVTGLTCNTMYYFAIKTADAVPNVSKLSNVPSASTTDCADLMAPGAITDLFISGTAENSITLSWTATGDDGNIGTASIYDIRYSTSSIDESNWNGSTQCDGEPIPKAAGQYENFTTGNLSPNTTYYFAIKTADEVPNWSELSNVVSATTNEQYGLVAYYPFEDSANDESGNGNDGIVVGASYVPGRIGNALAFAGDDYVRIPVSGLMDELPGTSMTIEAWIKLDPEAPNRNSICERELITDDDCWPWVFMTNNDRELYGLVRGCDYGVTGPVLSLDTWYHVSLVYEDTVGRLYIDGVLVATQSLETREQKGGDVLIGATLRSDDGEHFQDYFYGIIDEVKIWNVAHAPELP